MVLANTLHSEDGKWKILLRIDNKRNNNNNYYYSDYGAEEEWNVKWMLSFPIIVFGTIDFL